MADRRAETAFFLVRHGGAAAQAFPLEKTVVAIGRGADNDLVVDDVGVSRHHARLTWQGRQWLVEDLGSRNGTFVNGQRVIGRTWLKLGDRIACGPDTVLSLETARTAQRQDFHGEVSVPALSSAPRRGLWVVLPVVVAIALLILGAGLAWVYRVRTARSDFQPPQVLVTEPQFGAVQAQGSAMLVLATAFGHVPIRRVEFWLDGELKAAQESLDAVGELPFYAYSSILLPPGPHLLFARATDARGIIGQSLPIQVVGTPSTPAQESFSMVRAEAGQTLADIAAVQQISLDTVTRLNPELDAQPLPAGGLVKVPSATKIPAPSQPALSGGQPPLSAPGQAAPPGPAGTGAPLLPGGQPPAAAPSPTQPAPSGGTGSPPLQVIPPSSLPVDIHWVVAIFAVKPPVAPTALTVEVKDCKVILRWNDNATDESRYEVWMAAPGFPPRPVLTLKPAASGPVWCEFAAPGPGAFIFWVKAANLLGSAPSNIVSTVVGPTCPTTLATHLDFRLLDMTVSGGYDRVYFYTSFESQSEVRLPTDPNAFVTMQAEQANLSLAAEKDKQLAVPIPGDGVLNLSGEVWGWAGAKLSKVGKFSAQFPKDQWDGTRVEVKGNSFVLGLSIQAAGATQVGEKQIAYSYEDPNLPVPHSLLEEGIRSISGNIDPTERNLSWKWDGDPGKITAFKIYLNGLPYNLGWVANNYLTAEPTARSIDVRLPALCGKHIKWQVSAVAGEAESKLSAPFEYDQPQCPLFAEVRFNWVEIHFSDVGVPNLPMGGKHCDSIDTWYWIWANDQSKRYWGGTFFMPLSCKRYTFLDISGFPYSYNFPPYNIPSTDTIVVPLQGDKPTLRFGAKFGYDNFLGEPGYFGDHSPVPPISMTREEWAKFHQTFEYWGSGQPGGAIKMGVMAQLSVSVRGFTK